MNQAQINAILSPANGLLVYCSNCGTNGLGTLVMYMSGSWHTLTTNCLNPPSPATGNHISTSTQIIWNWNPVSGATGYKWSATNNYATATDMGTSTTRTETGLICNTSYSRYLWAYTACGNSAATTITQATSGIPINAPISGIHVPSLNQITWKWNAVTGATGYKWSTTNNYASATDMGTNLAKTETGLVPGISYARFVWAYKTCGTSSTTTLQQVLPFSVGQNYGGGIIAYVNGTGQHGVIAAATDQGQTEWGCYGTSIPGTNAAIGTGQANTTAIVSGCSTAGIAASICNDLALNGYSDWYLPSLDELEQLYLQRTMIGGFTYDYYWSSSEYTSDEAWSVYFDNGDPYIISKGWNVLVRAVRSF
jgi:hypothetical protein